MTIYDAPLPLSLGEVAERSEEMCIRDSISGITFNIPSMEDDQQLSIRLDVTLSNGQFLTAPGGTFSFLNGEMVSSVG